MEIKEINNWYRQWEQVNMAARHSEVHLLLSVQLDIVYRPILFKASLPSSLYCVGNWKKFDLHEENMISILGTKN